MQFRVKRSDGLEGGFTVSWCEENYRLPEFGLVIRGSEGIVNVNDDRVDLKLNEGESSRWYRQDLNDNVGFLLGAPEFLRENEYFVNSVLEKRGVDLSFDAASKVDCIIDQVESRVGK